MNPRRIFSCSLLLSAFLLLVPAIFSLLNYLHPKLFAIWRPLGHPPEKATSILGIGQAWDPDAVDVYLTAASGDVYGCCTAPSGDWARGTPQGEVLPRPCNEPLSRYHPKYPDPPGRILDCAETGAMENVEKNTIYVLLDSGEVFRLAYYYGVDTFLFIASLSAFLAGLLIAIVLALLSRFGIQP
jgi:hypothetical protein